MQLPKYLLKLLPITTILLGSVGVTSAQQKGDPPTVKEAFQITRSDLIGRIVSSDSLMMFKEEQKINGLPNYFGVDNYKSTVQLIGNDKELQSARFTFVFTTDKGVNRLQYMRMSYFVFSIAGQNGLDGFMGLREKSPTNP